MSAIISTNVDGTGHTPTVAIPQEFLNAAGATAIGVGIGTSFSIEKAGGWLAVAESTTGAAAYGAAGAAIYTSWQVGDKIGTFLYSIPAVRDVAIPVVGALVEAAAATPGAFVDMFHDVYGDFVSPPDIDGIWEIGFVASMVALNPFTNISP